MANTVNYLSYANTFGDQMVTTNALVTENNNLAVGTYTKKTGPFIVQDPSLSLQANGPVLLYNSLQVLGIGSSAYIERNLRVDTQVYFQNTTLGLTNSGQLISNGRISAFGSGVGLAVSNNTTIGGYLAVGSNASIIGPTAISNTLTVSSNTSVGGYLSVSSNASVGSSLSVTNNGSFGNNITVVNDTTSYNFIAQNNSNTATLTVRNRATIDGATITNDTITNILQANSSVNTATLTVTGNSITRTLQANASINTATLTVTGSSYTNALQANASINTASLTVTGSSYTNALQANASINTATLTVTGISYTNSVQANASINTATLTVTGSGYVNTLQANTSANTGTLSANTLTVYGALQAGTSTNTGTSSANTLNIYNTVNATGASAFFASLQTIGQLSVGGSFVLNGPTVYATNTFTLSANSTSGQISYFTVNRGSSGANAAIRWNEPSKYWDIIDVDTLGYSRILTTGTLTDSISTTSSVTAASATAVKTLNDALTSNVNSLQSQITSNSVSLQTQITSNVNILSGVNAQQNTWIAANLVYSQAGFARANASANLFTGTTGTATPTNGNITYSSTNGITISGAGSTLTIDSPQNLRTTDSPTFNGLTLTNALAIAQGGTGATDKNSALFNLVPTTSGVPTGYVLATGGGGGSSFYWAAGGTGGGGGTTPGTTIQSSRQTYTGNGVGLVYQTPTYVPGAAQMRVYINGVRQFASEYTETSGNTNNNGLITFSTAPQLNDSILFEVDGYIINPYYANNIAYTLNPVVSGTANTIQTAIDALASNVAFTVSPTLTGKPLAPTALAGNNDTQIATVAHVKNFANAGFTLTSSITGNAGTVTNGVYTSGSYSNPSWITSLAGSKISGAVASATDSSTLGTYSPQTSPSTTNAIGANQFVRSDGSSSVFLQAINSNTSNSENPTVSQVIVTNGTDNYYRKSAINGAGGFGSHITTLGTIATGVWNGSTIPVAYGGTGVTSSTGTGSVVLSSSPTLSSPTFTTPALGTPASGNLANCTFPTLNQNTTGSSASCTGSAATFTSTSQNSQFNSIGVGTAGSGTAGEIRATNNITAYYSDERLKTKLGNISNALDKVMTLNGFYFEPNQTAQDLGYKLKKEVGVSAQEVQAILPEIVVPAPIDDKYLTVHYDKLVPLLIEAIKELKAEIDVLKGNNK